MVVTMHCFANRSASMPRLDMEPPDPDELGVLPPLAGVGVARNRQFTIYSSDRTSNTLSSSGYNTLSRGHRGSRGSAACFNGCFPYLLPASCAGSFRNTTHSASAIDVRRQPISAGTAKGFWNGITELKNVLTPGNPLLENNVINRNATFYVGHPSKSLSSKKARKMMDEEDQFFKDINTLYQRQKVLFQKCCEQLKDIYLVEGSAQGGTSADLNNEFYLFPISSQDNSESSENEVSKTNVESPTGKKSESGSKKSEDNGTSAKKPKTSKRQKVLSTPFGETDKLDSDSFYVDIIYAVLHMIGCDVPKDAEASRWQMVDHLRKAFRLSPSKHMELYEIASMKEEPDLKLNLFILEAKELKAKDNLARPLSDGSALSRGDPFVTFYLRSKPFEVRNTGCKSRTLDPVWNESFAISLPNSTDFQETDEVLHLDVWNFLPDEKLREKLKRINEVKDSKGLRQYIVEAVGGSNNGGSGSSSSGGASQQKLIGSVEIPIKEIPASGFNKWWPLEKLDNKSNKRNRGEIHLLMHLSTSDKSHESTLADHRRLLRILISHELIQRRSQPFEWKDEFCKETLQVLAQHAVQGRMSRIETAMTRWLVYVQMHLLMPLDYRVFTPILEKLRKHVQTRSLPASAVPQYERQSEKDLKEFDVMAEKFTVQCIAFVRRHRYYLGNNFEKYYVQLEAILKSLHIIHCLKWRTRDDIVVRVEDALVKSDNEWYRFVADRIVNIEDTSSSTSDEDSSNADPASKSSALRMRNLTRVTHLLIADIESGASQYRELFRQTLNIDYVELAFKEYENQLRQSAKGLVRTICDSLIVNHRVSKETRGQNSCCCPSSDEGISSSASSNASYASNCDHECVEIVVPEFDFLIGSRLFELYLALQKFYAIGKEFSLPTSGAPRFVATPASSVVSDDISFSTSSSIASSASAAYDDVPYYMWFLKAVAKWLDIALFKAVRRILKAVELDTLKHPVDQLVRHTNSAVDIRTVFGQIGTFWHQLSWPDPETSYVFVSRMLDDVCKSAIFYAEKMCAKAAEQNPTSEEDSETSNSESDVTFSIEQCHAINNIEFVLQSIRPFVEELKMNEILRKIEDINGGLVADACRKTVKVLVDNAVENVETQILNVLERLGSSMAPTISRFLIEYTKTRSYQQMSPSTLLHYLDSNLIFLKSNLVPENFERVLAVIWATSASSLSAIIHDAIAAKKPVGYFIHLYQTFRILLNFFYGDDIPTDDTSLASIDRLLKLFASDGHDLLQNYYEQRYSDQEIFSSRGIYQIGSLTVRAIVDGFHLRIEVLNARHLMPLEAQQAKKIILPSAVSAASVTAAATTTPADGTLRRRDTLRHSISYSNSLSSRTRSVGTNLSASQSTLNRKLSGSGTIRRQTFQEYDVDIVDTSNVDRNYVRMVGKELGEKLESFRFRIDEMRLQLLHEAVLLSRSGLSSRTRRSGRDESWNSTGNRAVVVGMSNPYVTIRLVPDLDGSKFRDRGLRKVKTKTQPRTLYPLFDETFDLLLPEDTDRSSTYILFTVKDKGVMGEGIFLGEAILPLRKIIRDGEEIDLKDIPQMQMALTRPGKDQKDILFALQTRLNESTTKDFLRKERRKLLL